MEQFEAVFHLFTPARTREGGTVFSMHQRVLPGSEWPTQLRSIAILDAESIYFTAIHEALHACGFSSFLLPLDEVSLASTLQRLRTIDPDAVLIGSWLDARIAEAAMLRVAPRWPLIVVALNKSPLAGRGMLAARISRGDSPILCSARDLDDLFARMDYSGEHPFVPLSPSE